MKFINSLLRIGNQSGKGLSHCEVSRGVVNDFHPGNSILSIDEAKEDNIHADFQFDEHCQSRQHRGAEKHLMVMAHGK